MWEQRRPDSSCSLKSQNEEEEEGRKHGQGVSEPQGHLELLLSKQAHTRQKEPEAQRRGSLAATALPTEWRLP